MLNPTPLDQMLDGQGRPYFMRNLTLEQFLKRLNDPEDRSYLIAQLMREARPDDVFSFLSPRDLLETWPQVEELLGRQRVFWDWLLRIWEDQGLVWR
ncbi:MAG: hypothetical protein ACJ76Y_31335 [Thermoanaerobaculia bacterium]